MPEHADVGMLASEQRPRRLEARRTGARRKNWIATSFWARCSAVWDITREPVKRQMMITLAKPSTAESSPKPTSAIEPARMPATIATTPSTLIAPSDSQDSSRTRARELAIALRRDRRDRPRGRAARCDERELDRGRHALAPRRGATAATSARPRSVSSYMTILPCRVAVARPAARSARA